MVILLGSSPHGESVQEPGATSVAGLDTVVGTMVGVILGVIVGVIVGAG